MVRFVYLISLIVAVLTLQACGQEAPPAEAAKQPQAAVTESSDSEGDSGNEENSNSEGNSDVEWPVYGLDHREQRYSELDQINRDNIDQLELAWSFDLFTRRGVEATPLMINGTLYLTGGWSMVYAVDARTGEKKWFYDPQVDRSFLAKGCCDAVNRGVAHHNGKIYVGTFDGRLIALDAESGKLLWEVQTTDKKQKYTITMAPRVVKNLILVGTSGAELGVRGYVSAYDADSGELAWRFYTVPGNPADGFENDAMKMAAETWNGKWWEYGGGGTVWDSIVYDPELELIYVGVGNGSPWNQNVRSPGGGDNLFLSSIVALKPDNGEYVWHYQTTPGDSWDFTAVQQITLADIEIDGKMRKVLMQAPKNGFFYVLDRETGELLRADPYTDEMNWATHVDMKTGRPVETDVARKFTLDQHHLPSNPGAHNWHPMAYNPETGLVYIPHLRVPAVFLEPTEEKDILPDQGYWNVGFDRESNSPPKVPEQVLADGIAKEVRFRLMAFDPIKGEERWTTPSSEYAFGGALATASGLVFAGTDGHYLGAFDAATGEKLWRRDTQTMAMAAPITYTLDGEQYIAVAVGIGGGLAAEGGPIAHAWKIPILPRLLVYKLGGKHELPPVPDLNREMPKPLPVTGDAEMVKHGEIMFQRHCAYCHGEGLRTGWNNPDLRWASKEKHAIWTNIVIDGILSPIGMVSFKKYITTDDALAIQQYVLSEANRLYNNKQAEQAAGNASADSAENSAESGAEDNSGEG